MRGYVVEGVLTAAGAAGALTVGLRSDTMFWTITGMLLAGVALACLAASLKMKLTGPADPESPAPRRVRKVDGSSLSAVPPAASVRRISLRRRPKPGPSDLAA